MVEDREETLDDYGFIVGFSIFLTYSLFYFFINNRSQLRESGRSQQPSLSLTAGSLWKTKVREDI